MKRLHPTFAYAAAVVFSRGLSLVTIPLVAHHVEVADYGRLDVAVSIIEFTGLVLALGLSDTMLRFAGSSQDGAERKRLTGEVLGVALVLVVLLGLVVQFVVPIFAGQLAIGISNSALSIGLAGASLSGLIDMPLAFMRLSGRSGRFLGFICARGVLQLVSMTIALQLGFGASGVIVSNALVDGVIAVGLLAVTLVEIRPRITLEALRRTVFFGVPLVGAALASFVLGSCDRWFLANAVTGEDLAHYAIATKLGLGTALLMQPFSLQWYARRFSVLSAHGGLEESARFVAIGFTILILAATAVSLAGPVFIAMILPPGYMEASFYLPFLVLCVTLNESCSLVNIGCYTRNHSGLVLLINSAGAICALVGYAIGVPLYGVAAAIGATIIGHSLRLTLFLIAGHSRAPIPYPYRRILPVALMAIAFVAAKPNFDALHGQIIYGIVALVCVGLAAYRLGMIRFQAGQMAVPEAI